MKSREVLGILLTVVLIGGCNVDDEKETKPVPDTTTTCYATGQAIPGAPQPSPCLPPGPDIGYDTRRPDTTLTPDVQPDVPPDTREQPDTWDTGRDVPPDTGPDTTPDTGPTYPNVGLTFNGPTATGTGDTNIKQDYGIGLYWQSALSQHGTALHFQLRDRPVVTMSRILSEVGNRDPIWKLPQAPAEKFHFYKNYCDEVGEQTCTNQGIDDDTPTFALIMLGILQAPDSGQPSDCTFGMIYGKTKCSFGATIAPSPTHILLYAYREFDTSSYPVFQGLGLPAHTIKPGYNFLLVPPNGSGGQADIVDGAQTGVVFVSDQMFPMLYP